MKVISLFSNKGGVGKTTLGYHLASALADMGKRILIIDLDPQYYSSRHKSGKIT